MSGALPETRVVDLPPCAFEDFLLHMNTAEIPEWTWTFIEMAARFGVCYSSPENTIIARPVNSTIGVGDLMAFNDIDPDHPLSLSGLTKQHDTWHILYASGSPSFFFSLCPYELEFLSWHRNKGDDNLRTYKFQKMKDHFYGR